MRFRGDEVVPFERHISKRPFQVNQVEGFVAYPKVLFMFPMDRTSRNMLGPFKSRRLRAAFFHRTRRHRACCRVPCLQAPARDPFDPALAAAPSALLQARARPSSE